MSHRNLLAVTLASICTLSSLSAGAQPNPPGFPTQPKFSKLMQLYIDIFNAHEFDRFDEIFSEDYLLVSTAGTFQGRDNVAALMEGFVDAFPDLTYTFEEILVDGNNVVIRYSWSGTNTGSFEACNERRIDDLDHYFRPEFVSHLRVGDVAGLDRFKAMLHPPRPLHGRPPLPPPRAHRRLRGHAHPRRLGPRDLELRRHARHGGPAERRQPAGPPRLR